MLSITFEAQKGGTFMRSIRTKITLMTMVAIVVSVLLIGGVAVLFIRDEAERESDREMTLLCDSQRKSLNEYMMSIEQTVDMLARYITEDLSSVELMEGGVVGVQGYGSAMAGRDWLGEKQAALDAYLVQHEEKAEAVFRSAANHTHGVIAYYYRLNPEITENFPGFLYTKIDTPSFAPHVINDIFSYSMDDISHIGWYSLPLQRGRPSWLEPYYNLNLDQEMVSYVDPIYKAGTFIGIVGMDIGYETLKSQIDSIRIYETGYACLVDAEGNVVYHPYLETGSRVENAVPEMAEAANNQNMEEDEVYIFRYTFNGMEKKAVFSQLENGLRLMIMAPAVEISAGWYEMIKSILFIGGMILLVFAIGTTFVTVRLIEPLQTLTAASQRLAEGDYEVKLEYEGNDEVGILTNSFQRLVEHLKVYINDLNSKAYKDALTHVKNKGAFEVQAQEMDERIESAEGEPLEFAVGMFDCNFLKNINDHFGHPCGDIYLKTGCMFICKIFQHSPVFRVGGDEFAVLLQNEDYQNMEILLRHFDEEAEHVNERAEHPWVMINFSKGVAVYDPETDRCVNDVFNRADQEMYQDKVRQKAVRAD